MDACLARLCGAAYRDVTLVQTEGFLGQGEAMGFGEVAR